MINKNHCLSFILVLLSIISVVSCSFESGTRFEYRTVTFDSNGGTSVDSQIVVEGCTAVKPVDPVFKDHDFIGWFDEDSMLYDFSSPVSSDITLKANWTAASTVQQAASVSDITFTNKVQDKEASFSIQITPNGEKDDITEITIPAGAITTSQKDNSLSSKVTIISYAVEVAPVEFSDFEVQGNGIVVAGIDCKLEITENGQKRTIEDFNGQKVKVSTYTLKGLNNVEVLFNGEKDQPTDVTYDSATGLLTFCTNHFSTFLVTSDAVAYIEETKYAYDTLSAAIAAAKSGEKIILLKDIEQKDSVNIKEDLIIDLKGQKLTASLTSGNLFNVAGSYSFEIDGNDGTIEIGEGYTTSGSFIYSEKGTSTVSVHDATFSVDGGVTNFVAVYCKGVSSGTDVNSISIKEGSYVGAIKAEGTTGDAYVYISGGTFTDCSLSATAAKSHIEISGGTFDIDPSAYTALGYYAKKNTGTPETWTVLPTPQPDANNKFTVSTEAELDAVLSIFNSGDSNYENKDYTIELGPGTFGGIKNGDTYIAKVYVLKQYAKWNDDYNSRDNLQGVLNSHRGLTIVGSSDPDNRTNFKGIFVIAGNGNSNDYCYDDNVKTVIQNIDFDYTDVVGQSGALNDKVDNEGKYFPIVVCAAASNINIEGCTFKHTERIKIGFSANAVTPKEFYDENGKVRYLSGYGFFTTIKNCKFDDVNAVADGYPKGASDEQKGYYKEALILDNITASGLTSGFVNIQSGSNVMDTVIKNCTASGSAGYGVRVQAEGGKVTIKDSTITITGEDNYFLAFKKNSNIEVTLDNVTIGSGGSMVINSITPNNTVEIINPTNPDVTIDNTPEKTSFTLNGSSPAILTDSRTQP